MAASHVLMPRSRGSLTSRSCSVRLACSTRPFARLVFAQKASILSLYRARPNCATPLPAVVRTVLQVEHARLVAIERHRLAVRAQILRQRLEIAEGQFGAREVQRHQPSGRVLLWPLRVQMLASD